MSVAIVTGSSGYLGRHLCQELKRHKNVSLIGVDVVPGPDTTHVGSVVDKTFLHSFWPEKGENTVVFHCGALHKPNLATHGEADFLDVNVKGTMNLLTLPASRFVFASSTTVYSGTIRSHADAHNSALWVDENTPVQPKNIYGVTKVCAESLVRLASSRFERGAISLRLCRFFPELDDGTSAGNSHLSDEQLKLLNLHSRRLDISDVVAAMVAAGALSGPLYECLVISNTTPAQCSDCKQLYKDASILIPSFQGPLCLDRVYDNSRARALLHWQPQKTLFSALPKTVERFGFWSSPISVALAVGGKEAFSCMDLVVTADETFYVTFRPDGSRGIFALSLGKDVLPSHLSAQSRVHEYGGGAMTVHKNGCVYFVNKTDQRIFRLNKDASCDPITAADSHIRFGDLQACDEGIVCVAEDHSIPEKEPTNSLVVINLETGQLRTLLDGHDFFACPRVHGSSVAIVAWDHPNMPWDETTLYIVSLVKKESPKVVTSGFSIRDPCWTSEGTLFYLSDESGFYNVHSNGKVVYEVERDFGSCMWTLGRQQLCAVDSTRLLTKFGILDVENRVLKPFAFDGHVSRVHCQNGQTAIVEVGFPTKPRTLMSVNLDSLDGMPLLSSPTFPFPVAEYVSIAQEIRLGPNEVPCFYYPPKNPLFIGSSAAPPLICLSHGGPTSSSDQDFSVRKAFFCSRGFGILDVQYRGSSDYGRKYRNSLRGNWGVYDLQDMQDCALAMVDKGLADPKNLFIQGSSAGGYTTLCALTFSKTFRGGCSRYGICDLEVLARETHKFEARYLDSLVGPFPEKQAVYRERSPIFHAAEIATPVLFLHGDEDRVVPLNQAQMFHEILVKKKIQTELIVFKGEGHGFRAEKNRMVALEKELEFWKSLMK